MKIKLLTILLLTLVSCQDNRTSEQIISDIKEQIEISQYENALNDLDKLISDKIETSEIYTLKGQCETELSKNSESLSSFHEAIRINKNYYKAYIERAVLKLKLGDYKSSIEDCNKAMLLKKDFAKTYKTKAKAYELLEDEPNAIIQYQAAIKYGDDSGETNYKLGVLLLNKGNIDEGCKYLSIAGEKAFMDAYDLIKVNCNEQLKGLNNGENLSGQFRSFPTKFAITFPSDWSIDKISNSDNSTFVLFALGVGDKDGNITISETEPIFLDPTFKPNSIYEIDKDEFIEESKNKYSDFKLLKFKKIKIDKADAYYYQMSFSFFSTKLQKQLSGTHSVYVFLHPKTKKLYNIIGSSDKDDEGYNKKLLEETVNSFKFL